MALLEWQGLKNKLGKLGRRPQTEVRDAGTGPGVKCEGCREVLMRVDFEAALRVCPLCGHHHTLPAAERVQATLDYGSFVPADDDLAARDVLKFTGLESYAAKLAAARKKTGLLDAILSGFGRLKGRAVAFAVTDAGFMAGSMGAVVGERFVRLAEEAVRRRLALIVVSGSGGGARMYEGLFSLMQMAKTSSVLTRLDAAGLPFVSVCTHSTMGGVWASWAGLGDVIIAEPRARIGFTGPRVIKTTINAELPEGFQLSEFLLERGQVDMIVPRSDMRDRIASILDKLMGPVTQTNTEIAAQATGSAKTPETREAQ